MTGSRPVSPRVQDALEDGERVEGVLRVVEAGWPGNQGLVVVVLGITMWTTWSHAMAAVAVVLGASAMAWTLRPANLVLTDRAVLVVRRRSATRWPVDSLEVTPNRGGSYVSVAGAEMWVPHGDRQEAERLATLSLAHRP